MKKFFSLLCAMMLVLSASAAPVKMTSKANKAQLPAIEKSINHNRMVSVKAATTNIKKAPAAVNNGQILADYSQAYFISSELTETVDFWEFDFYNGNDFSAYIMVEANDDTHLVGTYNSIEEGEVIVAAGDTIEILSGSLDITFDIPSSTYTFVLTANCADGETYTMNQDFVLYTDFYALDYMLVMYLEAGYGWLLGISDLSDCIIELEDAPKMPVVVTDTVSVTFEPYFNEEGEGGWTDMVEAQGWWQYQGETADQTLYVTISPAYTEIIAGTYTIEDMDLDYTYIYDEVADAGYDFESLNVVITENNGVLTITASGVCENGVYYIMTCNVNPTALSSVKADCKAVKSIENGRVVLNRDGIRFDAAGRKF